MTLGVAVVVTILLMQVLSVVDGFKSVTTTNRLRPTCSTSTSVTLFAKPKRQRQITDQQQQPSILEEIPANLRRKVHAKRPPLGHVVPAAARRKRGGSASPKLRPQGQVRDEVSYNNPSNLRICSGTARGRRLDSPATVYLRPMMGKVREAVFSTLQSFGLYDDSTTVRHLDVFAGSGSVGLESLSRGARHCTFVDLSQDCCACIERNLELTCLKSDDDNDNAVVIAADAMMALQQPQSVGIDDTISFQIVTLCPPYEEVVYGDLLEAVVGSPCVTEDTVIVIEYPVELGCLPHAITSNNNTAVGVRNRRYGRTVIAMYVVNPTGRWDNSASSRPEEFVAV